MNGYAVQTSNILAILFYTILLLQCHVSLYNWYSFKVYIQVQFLPAGVFICLHVFAHDCIAEVFYLFKCYFGWLLPLIQYNTHMAWERG